MSNTAFFILNTRIIKLIAFVFAALLLIPPVSATMPAPQEFGEYTVHYNAFTSDTLQPSMAKAYGIRRSKNRGLITLSILKKSIAPVGTPVKAQVNAKASNLTGQLKSLEFREIDDGNAVYYLSEFRVAHQEVMDITIEIKPSNSDSSFTVKFRQQFYTQ